MNSRADRFRHNHSAPLANGRGSAQQGGNEMQRIADQRPEAALQRQVQAWGDGSERVGQLRAWQRVADGRGAGGQEARPDPGFAAPVVQRVGAGIYFTTEKCNLRDKDKHVLSALNANTQVSVADRASTSNFAIRRWFSTAKDHTWVTCGTQEGWVRDNALGRHQPLPGSAVARPQDSSSLETGAPTGAASTQSDTRRPIPIPTRGGLPSSVNMDQLNEYRDAAETPELEVPETNPGAVPLGGMGRRPNLLASGRGAAPDFVIKITDGYLYNRTGTRRLTVDQSPFVLSSSGTLYGGQGDVRADSQVADGADTRPLPSQPARRGLNLPPDFRVATMENHGLPEVSSAAWAGELGAADGKVTYINNQSGTFMFSDKANVNLIKFLYRHRVLTESDIHNLEVERVFRPGEDRDGKLERHNFLKS